MANRQSDDDFDENALFGAPKAPSTHGKTENPLAAYFRTPGVHVRLPTGGKFMPEGSISFTMANEVPVYPMRAADELLMKSPDALMSGYALEQMLDSCVPAIKNPRLIATCDLDVLLLAIKAASFGENMEVSETCPHCDHVDNFHISLPGMLGTIPTEYPDNAVRLSKDLVVYVRPYNLQIATRVSMAAFNEARSVQRAEAMGADAAQKAVLDSYGRLTELNLSMMAESIIKIGTPDGIVSDPKFIGEFVQNVKREWTKKIDDKIKELNDFGMDKTVSLTCSACSKDWSTKVEFDPSSFFDPGS